MRKRRNVADTARDGPAVPIDLAKGNMCVKAL